MEGGLWGLFCKGTNPIMDFPSGSDGKASCLQCGRPGFDPWVEKILWRRKWQPTPVFLPGEAHGQRSLAGYSPPGRKELDTTEQLHFHFLLVWTSPVAQTVKRLAYNAGQRGSIPGLGRSSGEGNGKPFQYSCLENPVDRGAWWATVHGVAKSRTRLSDFTSLHFRESEGVFA